MLHHKKMLNLPALLKQVEKDRKNGKKIVFTNGCFDILHAGHADLLKRAKELGDVLVLALNTDASVKRQGKGDERPINPYEARAFLLSHLESVDYVVPFDDDTPYELIKLILPDVLVKGGDWEIKKIVGHDIIEENNGKVFSLPLIEGYSTTNIVKKISSGS